MGKSIPELTAVEIVSQIQEGTLSPTEVVDAYLDRIEKRDEITNSFITITDKLAYEMSGRIEKQLDQNKDVGPLQGVPVAVKDISRVEGVRTTSGSLLYEDRIATEDSPFVQRLKDAGAIIIGKTSTPEFALGTTTNNQFVGQTATPFDPERVSGGSSGGSAAAVGDLLVPIAHGTDAGGSIRVPAAFCGVFGFKPTFGLIPMVDRPNAFLEHTPFSHHGPITRTVEDAALMLDVMAGYHPQDPFSVPAENNYQQATEKPINDMKIAYSPDMGVYSVNPDIKKEVDETINLFENKAPCIDQIELDLRHNLEEILDAYYTFAKSRWKALLENIKRNKGSIEDRGERKLQSSTIKLLINAEQPTMSEFRKAERIRTNVFDDLQKVFENYDLLITPTTSVKPFPHGEYPESVNGVNIDSHRGWLLTQLYNFTGHPSASIPAGFVDELPVGMQIGGPQFADSDVLAVSATFEEIQPWQNKYTL